MPAHDLVCDITYARVVLVIGCLVSDVYSQSFENLAKRLDQEQFI